MLLHHDSKSSFTSTATEKIHRLFNSHNISINNPTTNTSLRKITPPCTNAKSTTKDTSSKPVTLKLNHNRVKSFSPYCSGKTPDMSNLPSAPALCKQVSKSCGVSTNPPVPAAVPTKPANIAPASKPQHIAPTKDALLAAAKVLDRITDRLDEKYARLKQENRLLHAELKELQEEQRRINGDVDCECGKTTDGTMSTV